MELSNKQKEIQARRTYVYSAYLDNEAGKETGDKTKYMPVSILVYNLAKKFKVTEVQIYNDIKYQKETA
jgi:hypothetical protein